MAFIGAYRVIANALTLFQAQVAGPYTTRYSTECQKIESEIGAGWSGQFTFDGTQYAQSPSDFLPQAYNLIEFFEGSTEFPSPANAFNAWYSGASTPVMTVIEMNCRITTRPPDPLISVTEMHRRHRIAVQGAVRVLRNYATLADTTNTIQFIELLRVDRLTDDFYASSDTQRRVLRSQIVFSAHLLEPATGEGTPGGGNIPPIENIPV